MTNPWERIAAAADINNAQRVLQPSWDVEPSPGRSNNREVAADLADFDRYLELENNVDSLQQLGQPPPRHHISTSNAFGTGRYNPRQPSSAALGSRTAREPLTPAQPSPSNGARQLDQSLQSQECRGSPASSLRSNLSQNERDGWARSPSLTEPKAPSRQKNTPAKGGSRTQKRAPPQSSLPPKRKGKLGNRKMSLFVLSRIAGKWQDLDTVSNATAETMRNFVEKCRKRQDFSKFVDVQSSRQTWQEGKCLGCGVWWKKGACVHPVKERACNICQEKGTPCGWVFKDDAGQDCVGFVPLSGGVRKGESSNLTYWVVAGDPEEIEEEVSDGQ